jgi:hypothetical protein
MRGSILEAKHFNRFRVRYLVVTAYAVMRYIEPRQITSSDLPVRLQQGILFMDMPQLAWILLGLSGAIYPAIYIAYRRRLGYKKAELLRILCHGSTFAAYAKAFSREATAEQTTEKLFEFYYAGRAYILPILLNIVVTCGACAVVLIWFGWPLGLDVVEKHAAPIPPECGTALAGAFVWGLYDILQRYETIDLSPVSLHYLWLRMLVATALAPLLSSALTVSLKPLLGFAIGTFPISALQDFIKRQAKDKFNLSGSAEPTEGPTLNLLEGMTDGMLARLLNEGYESIQQLANADPFKLLLKTNLDWKTVLDLIDQAILFDYTGPNGAALRSIGIRGSIELATTEQDLRSKDQAAVAEANKLVAVIAAKLGQDEVGVRNLVKNAFEDVQVNLLWDLWGDEEVKTDRPKVETEIGGAPEVSPHDVVPPARASA